MDADLDTLATALYARVDDLLKEHPELAPWRPKVGIAPKLSDAELLTLAVLQVHQLIWDDELAPIRIGRSVRLTIDDLEDYVQRKRAA